MRKIVILISIVVIIPIFSLTTLANDGVDKYIDEFESIVPDELVGITDEDVLAERVGFDGILGEIYAIISDKGGEVVSFLLLLLGGVVILSLTRGMRTELYEITSVGVSVVLISVVASRLLGMLATLEGDIGTVSEFFCALIPIFSAVSVAGGGVSTAAVYAASMNTAASFVTGIVAPTFTATAALGFAVGLLGAIDPEIAGGVSGSVSKFFSWLVGIVTALLMGTLALQTVIGSVKDCASIRAARYAASGMIPVVGGTVAASLATLASGIAYVKGVIGVGAAAVIITLFLSPLVLLLLYRGAISIASTVASMLSVGVAARLYDSLRRGVDLYIAIYAVSILIYIFEIILFVMTEVPLG